MELLLKREEIPDDLLEFFEPDGKDLTDVFALPTAPFRGAHFATFSPKLIEPCILAGTSQKGQCPKCGKPWTRVVKVGPRQRHESEAQTLAARGAGGDRSKHAPPPERTFAGWKPTCKCDAGEPIPDVVLDIFNGSGTTGEVALSHGRSYIGCELKADYAALSYERWRKAGLLDADGGVIPVKAKPETESALLPGMEAVGA